MADIQLATHTVKSHGKQLLRTHIHDWIILVLLAVIDGLLNLIEPFHRFVGRDMMTDLSYPMKGNTVPFLAVPVSSPSLLTTTNIAIFSFVICSIMIKLKKTTLLLFDQVYAVIFPIIIFTVRYFRRRDLYDLHHAILGLLYSVLITAVITDAIKDAVGRPRPDFFWRCFPDGKAVYDPITTDVICHGDKSVIKEGHKSFPSGHSSWSFAGLGFLAWYLSGKIQVFDRRGHVAKLCIVFLPLLCAALVAISRVDDYWHHWQDVFTGGSIGLVIASFCYLQFFPAPYELDGWGPHAYFLMLAEMQREPPATTRMDSLLSTTQVVRQQGGVDMGGESPELEEMERGWRH